MMTQTKEISKNKKLESLLKDLDLLIIDCIRDKKKICKEDIIQQMILLKNKYDYKKSY